MLARSDFVPLFSTLAILVAGAAVFGILFAEAAAFIRQETLGGGVGLVMGAVITSLWHFGFIRRPVVAGIFGLLIGVILMSGISNGPSIEEWLMSAIMGAIVGAIAALTPGRVCAFLLGTAFACFATAGAGGITQPKWAVATIEGVNSALTSIPCMPWAFFICSLVFGGLCAVIVHVYERRVPRADREEKTGARAEERRII